MTGDVLAFYAELGLKLKARGHESSVRCFAASDAHRRSDRTPSASVSLISGAWICHGCGAKGGAYDAARVRGFSPRDAMGLLVRYGLAESRERGVTTPGARSSPPRTPCLGDRVPSLLVTEEQVAAWSRDLVSDTAVLARLLVVRGIQLPTLERFGVGWASRRLTIPLRDEQHELRGLVRHRPWPGPGPKTLAAPGSERRLFPAPVTVPGPTLVICEGEIDALTAHSAGLPAVSIPGTASVRHDWATHLAGRARAVIALDADAAGRAAARSLTQALAALDIEPQTFDPDPARDDGYDLGTLITDRGPRLAELSRMLAG